MKIIKKELPAFAGKQIECENCKSIIELQEEDIDIFEISIMKSHAGNCGWLYQFDCPICRNQMSFAC